MGRRSSTRRGGPPAPLPTGGAAATEPPADTASAPLRLKLGLLALSAATLLLQVTWTRVLSVALWYHFAFLVVSTAMLGFGLSGVLLTLSSRLSALAPERALPWLCAGQVASTLGGFALANRIPFAPFSLLGDPWQLLYAPLYLLCIALPFVFSGLAAALLLKRYAAQAGRIYFYDLVGAALGCLLVIVTLRFAGGSGAIVASAALAAGATAFFAGREGRYAAVGALLLLFAASPYAERVVPIRISQNKTLGPVPVQELLEKGASLYTGWNAISRVDVMRAPWGRQILIDGGTAVTRMPRVAGRPTGKEGLADFRQQILRPGQSVLVIGSGGGWHVAAALRAGARRVVAVEVNPLINDLVATEMARFVGDIFSDPRVELHTDEARSFIRRRGERFDAILAGHTISNAATASGAMSLAENYVVTVEALRDYLAHLTERGRLWISRPEAQLPRLAATARAALEAHGVADSRRHVLAYALGTEPSFFSVLVVSRAPLSAEEVRADSTILNRFGLRVLHLPGLEAGPGIYRQLLAAAPETLERLYDESAKQLRPATDDRPFFNQQTRWRDLSLATFRSVFSQADRARWALEDQPVGEVVLLIVLAQAGLLALLLILLPLWIGRRYGLAGSGALLGYFFLLGLGFILVEMALIQRFTLFIGQPVHTFATVVGALLLSSGLGSLLSQRLVGYLPELPRRLVLILCLAVALLLLVALGSPVLLRAALGLPLAARVALSALVIFPVGLVLGMPFPLGLRYAGQARAQVIPWAWGLNAVASVVGSVLAIVLATAIGFSGVALAAAAVYAMAVVPWLRRREG
ncbi:MAG: hypothetical protein IT371_27640 [Deltaproteobacteria bacterium]|nr:hypothetical protein [Deltaproteobacteria bacterium]